VLRSLHTLGFDICLSQERLTFDQILQQAELPEPGPDYFEARRQLWLTPRITPTSPSPSAARQKLENMLSRPNAIYSIELWNNGLERVWKGLCSGGKLKTRLPMALIVCSSLPSSRNQTAHFSQQDQDHTRLLVAGQDMAIGHAGSELG